MCNFDGTKCNTTKINKLDTWQVDLSGGITFRAIKHEGISGLDIEALWADCSNVESLHELTYQPADITRLADLFATVSQAVNE